MSESLPSAENDAPVRRCDDTCDYCRPDAWHGCTLLAGHEGYHSCSGYVTPPAPCACPPCPGRGNDGHGMTHCAECCFGTGVEADEDCPTHGRAAYATTVIPPVTPCVNKCGPGPCPCRLAGLDTTVTSPAPTEEPTL